MKEKDFYTLWSYGEHWEFNTLDAAIKFYEDLSFHQKSGDAYIVRFSDGKRIFCEYNDVRNDPSDKDFVLSK